MFYIFEIISDNNSFKLFPEAVKATGTISLKCTIWMKSSPPNLLPKIFVFFTILTLDSKAVYNTGCAQMQNIHIIQGILWRISHVKASYVCIGHYRPNTFPVYYFFFTACFVVVCSLTTPAINPLQSFEIHFGGITVYMASAALNVA